MKKTLTLIILLAGFAISTQATSILSDDFNYTNGPIVGSFGSPWLNNSGTANTMLVTNNPPDGQLEVSTSRAEDIAAPLSGGPYMTNGPVANVYSKFTLKSIPSSPLNASAYRLQPAPTSPTSMAQTHHRPQPCTALVSGPAPPMQFPEALCPLASSV